MSVPHLSVSYPLSRITLCLAAGIFLSDKLWADNPSFLWEVALWLSLAVVGVGLCGSFSSRRLLFGGMAGAAFFLWGGLSVLHQRQQTSYDWGREKAVYRGVVETVPETRAKTFRAEVRVEARRLPDGRWEKTDRNILLSWMPDSASLPLSCGDSICFYAKVSRPFSEEELTGFDYGDYLFRKGISGTALAYAGFWHCVGKARRLSVRQQAEMCREWVVSRFRSWGLTTEVRAVVSALTIGEKRELTPELKAMYSAAGVSHVLSLSGLHVGMLSAMLLWLLRPLCRLPYGRRMSALAVVVLLWAFAFISGLSSSVVRAVMMYSLYTLAALCSEERFAGVHSLVLSAFLMLVYNPFYLFDISFQLSFAAVFSIFAFYPLISGCFRIRNRLCRYVWNTFSLSVSAQLGTLPLILHYFGSFPTYFLPANLVVVALSGCILLWTSVTLCLSSVPVVGCVAVALLEGCTSLLNGTVRWVQQLAGSQITSLFLSFSQACLLGGVIVSLYLLFRRSGKLRRAADWIRLLAFTDVFVAVCCAGAVIRHPSRLYFSHSEVYVLGTDRVSMLCPDRGLMCVGKMCIGVFGDGSWRECESERRLPLSYAYVCKGFRGDLSHLGRLFEIRRVILDSSLSDSFRERLIKECQLLKISYIDLSVQGSYSVPL